MPRAFLGAFSLFAAFSVTSLFTQRRQALYLGAVLSTITGYMMLASLANAFLRWHFVADGLLWLGLFAFSGYVVYDTQVILAAVDAGHRDVISHALMLFVDLFAIFVRLVVLLMEQQRKRDDDENDRRRKHR